MLDEISSLKISATMTKQLILKLAALFFLTWIVINPVSMATQGADWIPWVVLIFLVLLDAYSTESGQVSWKNWSVGLKRLLSPSILPYYGGLALFLASAGGGQPRRFPYPAGTTPPFAEGAQNVVRHGSGQIPGRSPSPAPKPTSVPGTPTSRPPLSVLPANGARPSPPPIPSSMQEGKAGNAILPSPTTPDASKSPPPQSSVQPPAAASSVNNPAQASPTPTSPPVQPAPPVQQAPSSNQSPASSPSK